MSGYVVKLNKVPYNLVQPVHLKGRNEKPYEVTEVPARSDVDAKMERRVVWAYFSQGMNKHRDERSNDSSDFSPYPRQTRQGTGLWWTKGGTTIAADRILAQRGLGTTNITTASAPFRFGDASIYSWVACAQHLYVFTADISGVQQLALSKDFSAIAPTVNLTDVVSFNGKVYVATSQLTNGKTDPGKAQGLWVWDQASSTGNWTQAAGSPGYTTGDTGLAYAFVGIRNQLWRAAGNKMWSWDGVAVNWSTAYTIGDPTTNITALDSYRDALLIFKTDNIYTMDRRGSVYPVFPGFRLVNPRPLGQWGDTYYFASDIGMVWGLKGTQIERVGFELAEPYPMTSSFGVPNATTRAVSLANFMVVGFVSSADTSAAYFLALTNHLDKPAWCPFQYASTGAATAIGYTGLNQTPAVPRMQFAVGNTITYLSNPSLDPFLSTSFDTSNQVIYLPVDAGAIEDEDKVLESVRMIVDQASSATLMKVEYATDDNVLAGTYTQMTNVIGANTKDQWYKASQPYPVYKKISIRVTFAGVAASSPIIRTIVLHYKQRSPQRKVIKMLLVAENLTVGPTGRLDGRSTTKMIDDLNALRQTRAPVELDDVLGRALQVYVDEVGEQLEIFANNTSPSYIVPVTCVEATPY